MALVECGRFAIYPQALVARSALEAAGLHAVVFDEFRATLSWTEQFSLNGIRVMVLQEQVDEARALLADIDRETTPPIRGVTAGGSSLFLMFLLVAGMAIGWPS
jgi:hypothetical protein